MFSTKLSVFFTLAAAVCLLPDAHAADDKAKVKLSGVAYVTSNIDRSIQFYTEYMGFIVFKRTTLDSNGIREIYRLEDGVKVEYASLVPPSFSKDEPHPGLNFAQFDGVKIDQARHHTERTLNEGEAVQAYEVTNLTLIEAKMRSAKVPIIAPLAPSPTGKSMTLTVIDPNGVRVQMYEYINKPEFK